MTQTKATPPAKPKPTATPLEELVAHLAEKEKELASNETTTAVGKQELSRLKSAVGVIEANLAEFKKGGTGLFLVEQFNDLAPRVDAKLDWVVDQLGKDEAEEVQKAFDSVDAKLTKWEGDSDGAEKKLKGESDLQSLTSARQATRAKLFFESYFVKNLKDRITKAQDLWKEVLAVPTDYPQQYALLRLAQEQLGEVLLAAEYVVKKQDFPFPQDERDYEQKLVDAAKKMNDDAKKADVDKEALAYAKKVFDDGVKKLATGRGTRKKDMLAAVANAGATASYTMAAATKSGI